MPQEILDRASAQDLQAVSGLKGIYGIGRMGIAIGKEELAGFGWMCSKSHFQLFGDSEKDIAGINILLNATGQCTNRIKSISYFENAKSCNDAIIHMETKEYNDSRTEFVTYQFSQNGFITYDVKN